MEGWEDRALGLPKNSVKAIAMFVILGAVVYLAVTGKEIVEPLRSLSTFAIGFYFGKPSKEKKKAEDK